jgi:hypothetical protein
MSDKLRERLAQVSWEAADGYISNVPWESPLVEGNVFRGGKEYRRVDAILEEIKKDHNIQPRSGAFVVVERQRWERVRAWAAIGDSFHHELWQRGDPEWAPTALDDGDLDE